MERNICSVKDLLGYVPPTLSILFGGVPGMISGTSDFISKGISHITRKNIEWFDELTSRADVLEILDTNLKSAEYLQFLREVLSKVSFETRESKRQYFLEVAINYTRFESSFDSKMRLLNVLDRISEKEMIVLFWKYSQISECPIDDTIEMDSLESGLSGLGLLSVDMNDFNNALENINVTFDGEGNPAIVDCDSASLYYDVNSFGVEFLRFVLGDNYKTPERGAYSFQ